MKKYFLLTLLIVIALTAIACAPAQQVAPTVAAAQATVAAGASQVQTAAAGAATQVSGAATTVATAVSGAQTAVATAVAQPTTPPTPLPEAACNKMPNAVTPAAGSLGASDNPIIITFVPSTDVTKITLGGEAMAECLGKMTGLSFKVQVGTSEGASIDALGGGKAQMGFLNTFSILVAHAKYGIDSALIAQRVYGIKQPDGSYKSFDFDPDKALAGELTSFYKPEYFTRPDTGIKTLADIKGHTFCFTTAGSTSGGIIPRASIAALGIDPDKDIKAVYAGGHDKAAIGVYQGDCDAGVAFMDILTDPVANLQAKFPDLLEKVQVFEVGDRIPNDGLQYAKDFDPKQQALITEALLEMMQDPAGKAIVRSIYSYDALEVADYAKYYAPFEALLAKAGVDVTKLIKQ